MTDNKDKKVAVIGLKGLPAFGGAAAVGENIIENLKEDYDIYVYSTRSHTNLETGNYNGIMQIVFKQFPIKFLNTFYYYFLSMIHSLFIGKYDLIHLHHIDGGFIIPFLKLKYKVVTTSHGRPQLNNKWSAFVKKYFSLMEQITLKYSNKVISVSKPIQKTYKSLGYEAEFIPNGISLVNDFNPKKRYDISFAAGRIIQLKGLDTLFKALGLFKDQKTTLVIGDLDQTKEYKRQLIDLSDGLGITYTGLIKDKDRLFDEIASSEIFIFPSRYEAMSMMLLEVVSLQIPIICSDIISNKSIFNDDEVLFFKVGDYEDLYEKIKYAFSNKSLMQEKVARAYSKARTLYNWDNISKSYMKEFRQLIND